MAYFFGVGPYADVFRAALRTPNVLQNLLGEGTLSASFIPVYARLLEEGREEEAGRFAGAVFGLLLATVAALSLAGVLLAGPIVTLLAPGFLRDAAQVAAGQATLDRFPLAVAAVRILFPGTGFVVLSVWALGVLNSHRRFFLPYFAPVLWNAAIIAALVAAGAGPRATPDAALGRGLGDRLLFAACWGALAGGLLQLAVQLPLVARLLSGFRLSFSRRVVGVREALAAFGPVVAGRGVVQLSGYLDLFLGSLLATGALGAVGWAQYLYMLPVSLFGMSVAAAELPEMARAASAQASPALAGRLDRSLRQMGFLNTPTAVGYLGFGFLLVGILYRTGRFGLESNWLVYLILCGYTMGLLATTSSRLLQNAFYALGDTRTPAWIAVQRVTVSAVVSVPAMLWLDRYSVGGLLGLAAAERGLYLGGVGLGLGSAVGAWYELVRLDRALAGRVSEFGLPWGALGRMLAVALLAAAPAGLVWWAMPRLPLVVTAAVVITLYAAVYLGVAAPLGVSEADAWLGRLRRRFRRR